MLPKINSSHGSETRNIINAAIDSINVQGKSIQDLVAKGQLTPAQYATLIQSVNALISKGEVTFEDIDINQGKLLPKHVSEELLRMITGDAPINAVPADGSITTVKVADKAVTPDKTTMFTQSENLASLKFQPWSIENIGGTWKLRGETTDFLTKTNVVKLNVNTTYTVKNFEPLIANRFIIGLSDSMPTFDSENLFSVPRIVNTDNSVAEVTFTTNSNERYLFIYLSNDNKEPLIQVERGNRSTPYKAPLVLDEKYYVGALEERFIEKENTVTVIEDPKTGYPARPDVVSVIWIGMNEPTNAEIYDEWRETPGFTFFTDFTEYPTGQTVEDWSTPWDSNGRRSIIATSLSPDEGGGKVMEFNPNSYSYHAITWDELGEYLNDRNGEVFVRGRVFSDSIVESQRLSVVLRGSGTASNPNGYTVGVRGDEPGLVQASKYIDGQVHVISSKQSNVDFSNYFNMVVRMEDNNIKAKFWQYGDAEPKDWLIDEFDISVQSSGFMGLFSFQPFLSYIDAVGFGTGGMRAPRKKV